MEIIKGSASINLTPQEYYDLVEHDMVTDTLKLLNALDAMDINLDELIELLAEKGKNGETKYKDIRAGLQISELLDIINGEEDTD